MRHFVLYWHSEITAPSKLHKMTYITKGASRTSKQMHLSCESLCLRNILYPACSECRDQLQLRFPKTFQWNSKRACMKSRSSCRILEMTTLPNSCCAQTHPCEHFPVFPGVHLLLLYSLDHIT